MSHAALPSRPRSIIGPLLLIALGALWLLTSLGLISSNNVWAVLRFWPVVLIALGVDALLRWRWPVAANLVDLLFVSLVVAAIVFAPRLGLVGTGGWMGMLPFMIGGQAGSGQVVTETRALSDFEAVNFSSFGDLTIQPGERQNLVIEAEDDIVRHIRTEVRNGTLHIDFDQPGGRASLYPTRPIRLTLTVVHLGSVELSGAGNIVVNDVAADRLRAQLSGAGNLSASGMTDHLDVTVSGVGSFDGADLESESVEVNLSGVGGATVWATARLNATVSGVGSVTYFGQPVVTKTVSGLGTLRSAGNK